MIAQKSFHARPLLALVGALCLAGCGGSRPAAYNAYSPGQWTGTGARASYPWAPPPPADAPPPQPTLVGTAVTALGVLLGSIPQNLPPPPWVVPAPAPSPSPGSSSWASLEDEVLALTNERRAAGAVCGGEAMPPAPPVVAEVSLRAAARGHSRDMAERDYFAHASPEGAGPGARAGNAGYRGRLVGENIAAGQPDAARVVRAWLESSGHCKNMMDPRYRHLGVGYYFQDGDRYGHYWTQNFGG